MKWITRTGIPIKSESQRRRLLTFLLGACHALSTHTHFLPSLDAKRTVTAAYRESLRKQLRRRSPAPERDRREARLARFRQYSGLHREKPKTRGAYRPQFHAAPRALLREPGIRRRPA